MIINNTNQVVKYFGEYHYNNAKYQAGDTHPQAQVRK